MADDPPLETVDKSREAGETPQEGVQQTALEAETVKYLSELAHKSFDRYNELDESVWRSLPFFAATFGLAATVASYAASRLPSLEWAAYVAISHILLLGALLCFAWAFRWFWLIIRPRSFEYPADDTLIRRYAEDVNGYHRAVGLAAADLDKAVVRDLQEFITDQLADAARTNAANARERLAARSQALLFMMIGFLLAFCGSITTFVHDRFYGSHRSVGIESNESSDATGSPSSESSNRTVRKTDASQGSDHSAGGGVLEADGNADSHRKERLMTDQKPPASIPASAQPISRPNPPPPQRLEKDANGPFERR